MMSEMNDYYRSGRLIQWALRPEARPVQEPEYFDLIETYLDRREFADMVRDTVAGLGLQVIAVSERGMVLAPESGSVFAMSPAKYRPSASYTTDKRLLDGLVQVAIAATVFPRAQDLEEEPTMARRPITIHDVDEMLCQICDRLHEQSHGEPDPQTDELEGFYEAWRLYRSLPTAKGTQDGRQGVRTTQATIKYGLDFLCQQGCFTRESRQGESSYRPTWRYQVMVQSYAASRIYQVVHDLIGK